MFNVSRIVDYFEDFEGTSPGGMKSISYRIQDQGIYYNKLHCDELTSDGSSLPAYIEFHPNGKIHILKFAVKGKFFRLPNREGRELPHVVDYFENGKKSFETWLDDDADSDELFWNKSRKNGPSQIEYYDNERNTIYEKSYYLNDELHREDGPAIIQYTENGNISCELYYLHGRKYSRGRYLRRITTTINRRSSRIELRGLVSSRNRNN